MIADQADDRAWKIWPIIAIVVVLMLSSCSDDQVNGVTLSVMSYNVGNIDNPQPTTEQVANLIRKHGVPDVLLTQDTPWFLEIKDLAALLGLPYFFTGKTQVPRTSLGILSRFPLHNLDVIPFQGPAYKKPAAMCAEARIAARDVLMCSLHLLSPSNNIRQDGDRNKLELKGLYSVLRNEFIRDTPRSRSVSHLLDSLDNKHPDLVIIGGDFNAIQFSKPIRIMSTRFKDVFWPSWSYFQGTYTGLDFPLKPRLDYIFHSSGMVSVSAKVIKESVGDHFPVQAILSLPVDHLIPPSP